VTGATEALADAKPFSGDTERGKKIGTVVHRMLEALARDQGNNVHALAKMVMEEEGLAEVEREGILSMVNSVPLRTVLARLGTQKDWVDRVVVTGGEPTIHRGLPDTMKSLKDADFRVKLNTNGSNPGMVRDLVEHGLVDYVAMDVKGPLLNYYQWCGVSADVGKIRKTISFLMKAEVPYEFRMTVVPFLHGAEDVYGVAETLKQADLFTNSRRMPRPVGGDECERGGKEGVKPHPNSHPAYPISAGERNHRTSQQMELF
jgi:anaerobic ribonucleoside-triphosphate reductase activating protein